MSSDDQTQGLRQEVKKLRQQVAVLTSRNLELRDRVRELEAEKNEAGIEEVAVALARSLRTAELAMVEESQGQRRYAISLMDTTLRTYIAPREDGLLLRLPDPEQNARGDQLSSVQFTLVQMPGGLE